jgi:hypothetical protein
VNSRACDAQSHSTGAVAQARGQAVRSGKSSSNSIAELTNLAPVTIREAAYAEEQRTGGGEEQRAVKFPTYRSAFLPWLRDRSGCTHCRDSLHRRRLAICPNGSRYGNYKEAQPPTPTVFQPATERPAVPRAA